MRGTGLMTTCTSRCVAGDPREASVPGLPGDLRRAQVGASSAPVPTRTLRVRRPLRRDHQDAIAEQLRGLGEERSAARAAAPQSPMRRPRPASSRIAACDSASVTVIVRRCPARSTGHAPSVTAAQSSPPSRAGRGDLDRAAGGQRRRSGTRRRPARRRSRARRRGAAARRGGGERADADGHEQRRRKARRARRTASRSRRSPTAGAGAPTSAISSTPSSRGRGRGRAPPPRRSPSTTTTSAPSPAIASRRAATDRAGRNTRQRSPRSAATWATARPWLPALAATSVCAPGRSRSASSAAHDAPSTLNAGSPKRSDSSFSHTAPRPSSAATPSSERSGVGA